MRGTLASRTREAIFGLFGEIDLPPINTNAKPSDISAWKQLPQVSTCYKKLFEKVDSIEDDSPLTITRIIKKVLGKNGSNAQMAFVVVVCINILNPDHGKLKLSTSTMKNRIKHYLVSFITFLYLKFFY